MDGDVKVFDLICQVVQWEVDARQAVEAWTYNGVTCPARRSASPRATRSCIHVTNELPQSTAVHWHG